MGGEHALGADRDPQERQAERAAARVLGRREPGTGWSGGPILTRDSGNAQSGAERAPASVDRALASPGSPLEPTARHDMERRFGHDFSRVRVHEGGAAQRSARELGAGAYTLGNHIVFGGAGAGSRHVLAHELAHVVQQSRVIRPYRVKSAFNFGALDSSTLIEDSFNIGTDKETKPWIALITVDFTAKQKDGAGNNFWTGSASVEYHSNPAKWPNFSFTVAGGSAELGRTDPGTFTVHRIEGVGYNSGSFSGTPGTDYDPATREGPRSRYSKPVNIGGQLGYSANMSFAVFYNKGEALHHGPVGASSHGCVHVDAAHIQQVNYHSVIGLTKVKVKYPTP